MNLKGNKILVTGGASGIGLGLTQRFIEEGNTVIICGRRKDVLDDVKNKFPQVICKVCDLENEKDREELYNWIAKEHKDLTVLVNNAGIQHWLNVDDADFFARAKQEIAINIEAPLHLCSLFVKLPTLKTIMNVTSGLSYVPLVKVPVYSATKAFMRSFTTSLGKLLKQKNIEVIEIVPPALNTDLGGKGLHDAFPPVSEFIASIFDQLKQGKTKLTFGLSQVMANAGPQDLETAFERMNP
jgi:uncharacterized oxidoreductase